MRGSTERGTASKISPKRLKVYRRVATRYEKTSRMFLALILCSVAATYEQFSLWGSM